MNTKEDSIKTSMGRIIISTIANLTRDALTIINGALMTDLSIIRIAEVALTKVRILPLMNSIKTDSMRGITFHNALTTDPNICTGETLTRVNNIISNVGTSMGPAQASITPIGALIEASISNFKTEALISNNKIGALIKDIEKDVWVTANVEISSSNNIRVTLGRLNAILISKRLIITKIEASIAIDD